MKPQTQKPLEWQTGFPQRAVSKNNQNTMNSYLSSIKHVIYLKTINIEQQ